MGGAMKTAMVVTVGSKKESLGALKLARYLRRLEYDVEECTTIDPMYDCGKDLYCFSAVFSWRLPALVAMVKAVRRWGEVWIGGPAVTFHNANAKYVERETGIRPTLGIDNRFEREPGCYPMVYFSRGCPAYSPACGSCPVPRIEGNEFRYYPDAEPAPLLLDNNLSALPSEYQNFIISRYNKFPRKVDANSGFEPHTFDESTLDRWEKFPLTCWRFGYDDLSEREQALEMMRLFKSRGYSGEKVRVYTMIGNEPIESCTRRIHEVIAHGFHPWPQRLRPLDWLGPDGTLPCRFDWDEPTLIAFQRFYSIAGLWKKIKPKEFFYQSRYPLKMI
jgi:hypothetical protein